MALLPGKATAILTTARITKTKKLKKKPRDNRLHHSESFRCSPSFSREHIETPGPATINPGVLFISVYRRLLATEALANVAGCRQTAAVINTLKIHIFYVTLYLHLPHHPPILVQLTEISDLTRNFSDLFYINFLLLAPVFEEVFFRGIILEGFLSKYSVKKAVFMSSLFFAILHLNLIRVVHAFFLGIFMGWYYSKTRNLLSCMIIHFLNNFIYILLLQPAVDKYKSLPIPEGNSIFNFEHSWLTLLWSLLSIVISLVAIKRTMKTEPADNQTVQC